MNGWDVLGQFDWSRLKSMGAITIHLNNFSPIWPNISLVVNTYNHSANGKAFMADITLAFSWNATGALGRLVPRSFSVIAEVGFSGTGTYHVCGSGLRSGSSTFGISVFVQGSLGSGSRSSGPIQPPSKNPAHNSGYETASGIPLEGYTPRGSPPGNGIFATLRGQADWTYDIETSDIDWQGVTVYVDAGYRYGVLSDGATLGPYLLE